MSDSHRRDFLKKSAAAAAALGISGGEAAASPAAGNDGAAASAARRNAPQEAASAAATLRAVGAAVLPASALGDDGIERVVTGFEAWIEGFQPVAELPHGYLNRGLAEIRYGPPHPGPRWAAQIEALELEARARHRAAFTELTIEQRRALIEGQVPRDELARLPAPGRASHVALGLMAFFYDSSAATDLCYQASIGRYKCRGLGSLGREPRPLADAPPGPAAARDPEAGS